MKTNGVLCDSKGTRWLSFHGAEVLQDILVAKYAVESMPPEAVELFQFYEEIIETQQFSFLPEIEKKIAAYCLRVIWEDGVTELVHDVQIVGGKLSFKLNI